MTRCLDIILSISILISFLPLFLIIMIFLRFTGEGEIFFIQARVGKNSVAFGILKFATMLKNSPNLGTGTITVDNDARILPFGRYLRDTKINELPQLINVLAGDMSLVGPRPQAEKNFSSYSNNAKAIISSVRPGLTGVGSLVFSNEEELLKSECNPTEFYYNQVMPYKEQLEIWFVENRSVFLYIKVLTATFLKIILRQEIKDNFFKDLPKAPNTINL